MEERLDHLGDKITDLRAQKERYHDRVQELEARREEIDQAKRRKRDLEREITELEDTLADRRQSLDEAEERYRDAQERVEELSDAVDETVEAISDVESKIKYREAELNDVRDELSQLETRAEQVRGCSKTRARKFGRDRRTPGIAKTGSNSALERRSTKRWTKSSPGLERGSRPPSHRRLRSRRRS